MFSKHYQVIEKLSSGGMGVIYRALDTRIDREVAIKRLLPLNETLLNEEAGDSLKREASTLAKFQHPNVVTIHSFETDEEGHYVVMELIDGISLEEVIDGGAISCDDFENMVYQLLDPLVAAQELGVLHRDIKPANIMLRWLPSGKIQFKILDFGLAKFSRKPSKQTLDVKGQFLGSVDYVAPEQFDLKKLDQRADLYALGCVLYFAMTQRPPFKGKSTADSIENHLGNNVTDIRELRPDLPVHLSKWLMGLIKLSRRERPANAEAALATFEMAVIESRTAARLGHTDVEIGKSGPRFPWQKKHRRQKGLGETETRPLEYRDSKAG